MADSETIEIWSDSSFLAKQGMPRLGFHELIEEWFEPLLVALFGPPVFHLWILQELINVCRTKLDLYRGKKLIIVDVSINTAIVYRLIKNIVNAEGEPYASLDQLFVQLGYWLTEQLAAWLSAERAQNFWPFVAVRCTDKAWDTRSQVYIPENKLLRVVKFLFSKAEIQGITPPLFGICFPSLDNEVTLKTSLYSPYLAQKVHFSSHTGSLGIETFSKYIPEIEGICPLVAQNHALIVFANCPLDEKDIRVYIRHGNVHETWIVHHDIWLQIPRDAWVPVPQNARIVLGRAVDVNHVQKRQKVVLRGSLILKIEYKDY